MAADTVLRRITDYPNRARPYPPYAELREHAAAFQEDGSYSPITRSPRCCTIHIKRGPVAGVTTVNGSG
jgi:hypothetical protein